MRPLVTVVVPHYLGDIILECLECLYARTPEAGLEVIVVDNQPRDDGSLARVRERFPDVRLIRWEPAPGGNKGYGAGCNRGAEAASGQYVLFLNNDVMVADGWLGPMVRAMEADARVAACQPKLRSVREPDRFDYGGAAGGMMDVFGYAYCLGRLFHEIEVDTGQYDQERDIFWTIGAAMFVRRSALKVVGLMDEAYRMHMEEIDLCWRFHLSGMRILSVPESVMHHHGAMSLPAESFQKAYFNHRNNLAMVVKNWAPETMLWALPLRILMELATLLLGPLKGDWKHPAAALLGIGWLVTHPVELLRRRRTAQASRRVGDWRVLRKQYRGSVVAAFYLRGRRRASQLHPDL